MSEDPRRTQPFCTPRCFRECQCSRWPDYVDRWGNPVNHGSGGGPAGPWWLSGGVAAGDCVAAYQPMGAASYAASQINLNAPGTNDAVEMNPLSPPAWDAVNGWDATATDGMNVGAYITAGGIYSAAIRFTAPGNWQRIVAASALNGFDIIAVGGPDHYYLVSNTANLPPPVNAGILAMAADLVGTTGYINGIPDAWNWWLIGVPNGMTIAVQKAQIQAFTLHSIRWTDAQALAICTAMAAL